MISSFDPNRPDFAPYGFTCVRWKPSPMRRPDHHSEVELNLLRSGWVTYLLGGRKVRIEAGRLSLFWAAIPHQVIDYGDEPEYFVATIPFAWVLQCRLPDRLTQPLLRGVVVSEPGDRRARSDYEAFREWEQDLLSGLEERRRQVLLEMEARMRRLALALPELPPEQSAARRIPAALSEGGLNRVEQMACFIAQNYTEKLTTAKIGEAVNLHPNYAMSVFQKTFGTTLIDYLTSHRVSHAQRLLATTDDKIVEVALNSGFNSISRFNDAFKRACGCSPSKYRRQHRIAQAPGAIPA